MDYAAPGFVGERDPRQETISKSRRAGILAEMTTKCRQYVGGEFLNALKARCEEVLEPSGSWSRDVSEQDPNVVRFRYPIAASVSLAYVVPQVALELGTHAEFVPRDHFRIRSFVAEEFPDVVPAGDVGVIALLAKRTFWEKATILHAEFHRPVNKTMPARYSRHYYDIAMLARGRVRAEALADFDLLAQVVRHKEAFYPAAWAQYGRASAGSLRLLPFAERIAALERDYRSMGAMIFGQPPPFDEIMGQLDALEREINARGIG